MIQPAGGTNPSISYSSLVLHLFSSPPSPGFFRRRKTSAGWDCFHHSCNALLCFFFFFSSPSSPLLPAAIKHWFISLGELFGHKGPVVSESIHSARSTNTVTYRYQALPCHNESFATELYNMRVYSTCIQKASLLANYSLLTALLQMCWFKHWLLTECIMWEYSVM